MSYRPKVKVNQIFWYLHKGKIYYNLPRKMKKAYKKRNRQTFRVTEISKSSPDTHTLTLKP